MPELSLLAIAAAALPIVAALILRARGGSPSRGLVLGAAGAALVLGAAAADLDALSRSAMVLYGGLAFVTLWAAPKRDRTVEERVDALLILGGTLAAFATGNLLVLLAGWVLSAIPQWKRPKGDGGPWVLPRLILAAGTVALAASIALMAYDASQAGAAAPFSLTTLRNLRVIDNPWILGLVIGAMLTRKGIVPFHSSLVGALERGSLLNTMLFMNGHLGVYLLARLAMPLMPVTSHQALSPLADLALLSAACTSLMALTEKAPRRLLGLLAISQMSFLLAGLESSSDVGVNGAMVYLVVLSISTGGLFIVQRLVEVRMSTPLTLNQFHGLGGRMPRLATFFLVSAVALIGLPGTIGFVAEDLLFHGTLESHPELGLIMPIATALNAITLLRMFFYMFFGRRAIHLPKLADALPSERWALTIGLLVIVIFGFQPELLLTFTRAAAGSLLP